MLGYRWGPVGHPAQVGSTSAVSSLGPPPTDFQYDTLVWDDDVLLFTLNSSGQIDDLKVADFADYVPGASKPLTVWDRDTNGQIYGCHTGGASLSVISDAFQRTSQSCGTSSSFVPPAFGPYEAPVGRGGMLLIPKADGFNDGQNTFQGVRTYDPQAGVWTTPDAYHGDVHDPMSQKPYMWNGNNPYAYSDPTGYCWGPLFVWCYEIMTGAMVAAEIAAPGAGGVWRMPPMARGLSIEAQLGGNLPRSFPVIDRVAYGMRGSIASEVVSIKSLNTSDKSYASGSGILSMGKRYVDALAAFTGKEFGGANVRINDMTAKILDLVIPKGAALNADQQGALNALDGYAQQAGIQLHVIRM